MSIFYGAERRACMKTRNNRRKTYLWILVPVIIFALSLAAYAAYTSKKNKVKRVIATNASEGQLFASDHMSVGGSFYVQPTSTESLEDPYIDMYVCNYQRSNPGEPNSNTVFYSINVALTDQAGNILSGASLTEALGLLLEKNGSVSLVKLIEDENNPGTFTESTSETVTVNSSTSSGTVSLPGQSLTRGSAKKQYYRMRFSKELADQGIYVLLTADPGANSGLLPLTGNFTVSAQTINVETGWNGYFSDDQNKQPSAYDGFNYTVYGAGSEDVTLKWNSSLVAPNKLEFNRLFGVDITTLTPDADGWISVSLSLPINTRDERYDIQFYIQNAAARTVISSYAWDNMRSNVVVFEGSD